MVECWKDDDICVEKCKVLPIAIKEAVGVKDAQELLKGKPTCISYNDDAFAIKNVAIFEQKGATVVLDFGKEICGSVRFVVKGGDGTFRVTLGESLSEAYSAIGQKNATNDFSPRDFEVQVMNMSDLTFGQSGFRFARIELLSSVPIRIANIYAVSIMPKFPREGYIQTSDKELNKIIETAAYTLKANFQNGYIWDGIKRDRLVWSGDLNQEIITSIYCYGDNKYITNSLSFLRDETPSDVWITAIPTYSAWWIINLCDYCRLTGNLEYFEMNKQYAKEILEHMNSVIEPDGTFAFGELSGHMLYFLDWPTYETEDAVIGTAMVFILAAQSYLKMEGESVCRQIVEKLSCYLDKSCEFKQTRAFQVLAGRQDLADAKFLEKGGAAGFSTFMAYYLLAADAMAGGEKTLEIIKEYFGAMLSRGATSFWEDFHMDWLEGSGRIDELPKAGEKDIHGDFGAYCYTGFRHSLCHGWASGVLGFIYEYMLGLTLKDGGKTFEVYPHPMGVQKIEARIPVKDGWLDIQVENGQVVKAILK